MMVPEMEKPRVTEIRVRMDCNGCVQKVKKALHGVEGICDIYIDFAQQKVTVIGWADPAKIVKAIKKTRKSAIICSHSEQADKAAAEPEPKPEPESEQETEPEHEDSGPVGGGAPPSASTDPPTDMEEEKEETPSQPENQLPEVNPSPESANETSPSTLQSKPQNHEEIHVIYHHPPDYGSRYAYSHYLQQGNGKQWNAHPPNGPQIRPEPSQPIHVTHSYNAYKPLPYVTEYAYPSQRPPAYSRYSIPEQYGQVYYSGSNSSTSRPQIIREPAQPPQPLYYSGDNSSTNRPQIIREPSQPPQPTCYGGDNSSTNRPQIIREPSQLPQPTCYGGDNSSTNRPQIIRQPSQPPQPTYYGGDISSTNRPQIIREPSQPPQPIQYYSGNNGSTSRPQVKVEPSQPPQPIHYFSGNNSSTNHPQVTGEPAQPTQPIHYYSRNTGQWNAHLSSEEIGAEQSQQPQSIHVNHRYNTYKTSPYTTEYTYPQSPQRYSHYAAPDNYTQVYYNGNNGSGSGNGNITSMFSEENPNACSIV